MDIVRNIISNLYIYKSDNIDNLDMDNFGLKTITNKNEKFIYTQENNENPIVYNYQEQQTINNHQNNNDNKNIYENINQNIKEENNDILRKNNSSKRLDNYNQKYVSIKNNNFFKNDVNYVLKNKELLKEKESQMKELKLRKENEALSLLLSFKTRNTEGVKPRLYDYEIKQKEKNKSLLKNNKFKIRNLSSQNHIRSKNLINNENKEQNIVVNINLEENKLKKEFAKSLKMPKVKPTTSPTIDDIPLLHKDYGKLPEYLEKRKKELQEQKEVEIMKEKEKNIPSGYKILTNEERQIRLNDLNKEKKELEDNINKLPIARLSRQQQEMKQNIEKALDEIDKKINKLSGYKEVIVKNEEF